jgi:hypothetical protein
VTAELLYIGSDLDRLDFIKSANPVRFAPVEKVESGAVVDTLPCTSLVLPHYFPGFERAAVGAIYRRSRGGAVKCRVLCRVRLVPNARSTSTTK